MKHDSPAERATTISLLCPPEAGYVGMFILQSVLQFVWRTFERHDQMASKDASTPRYHLLWLLSLSSVM